MLPGSSSVFCSDKQPICIFQARIIIKIVSYCCAFCKIILGEEPKSYPVGKWGSGFDFACTERKIEPTPHLSTGYPNSYLTFCVPRRMIYSRTCVLLCSRHTLLFRAAFAENWRGQPRVNRTCTTSFFCHVRGKFLPRYDEEEASFKKDLRR